MEEKAGNPYCEHEWEYDDMVVATNPPISHRICKKCGRVEHEYGQTIIPSPFNELYQKFHK